MIIGIKSGVEYRYFCRAVALYVTLFISEYQVVFRNEYLISRVPIAGKKKANGPSSRFR